MNSDFVALQCPNCGGNLSVTKERMDSLFVESNGDFIYIGNGSEEESIECENCKTKFERRQRVSPAGSGFGGVFNQAGQVITGQQVNISTGGAAFIGGNVRVGGNLYGGTIVTGNNNVVTGKGGKGGKGDDFVGGSIYINGKRVS